MADPSHKQHKDLERWLGYDFDPIDFSIDSVNQMLLPARRRGKTAKNIDRFPELRRLAENTRLFESRKTQAPKLRILIQTP